MLFRVLREIKMSCDHVVNFDIDQIFADANILCIT